MRPAAMLVALPVAPNDEPARPQSCSTAGYSCCEMPMKTPASEQGPSADAMARVDASSSRRCCGSVATDSTSDSPTASRSTRSTPDTNEPNRLGMSVPASRSSTSQRWRGTAETESAVAEVGVPRAACTVAKTTPPVAASAGSSVADAPLVPAASRWRLRNAVRAEMVGKSKATVDGSWHPHASDSARPKSTAASESIPASTSG